MTVNETGCSSASPWRPYACSLDIALEAIRTEASAGLPVAIYLNAGLYVLERCPYSFDDKVSASEVRIFGSVGTRLQAAPTCSSPLLRIRDGSPELLMVGLTFHSSVAVEGGVLRMENCTHAEIDAELGGALQVSGGELTVRSCKYVRNKATRGGAVHVSGGKCTFTGCTFTENTARELHGGGALWVGAPGVVLLQEKTRMYRNFNEDPSFEQPKSESIFFDNGALEYALPAPLGFWIDSQGRSSLELTKGESYPDFPTKCTAGTYGNSPDFDQQSSPICSGLCPVGSTNLDPRTPALSLRPGSDPPPPPPDPALDLGRIPTSCPTLGEQSTVGSTGQSCPPSALPAPTVLWDHPLPACVQAERSATPTVCARRRSANGALQARRAVSARRPRHHAPQAGTPTSRTPARARPVHPARIRRASKYYFKSFGTLR